MAKRTSRFGSNVVADVEKRKKEGSKYGYLKLPEGVNIFKEKEGKVKVDIIPYIVTDEHHMDANPKFPDAANPGNPWYKKPFYTHRSVGAEKQSIVCPKTVGKKCPICEHRAQQQAQGLDKKEMIDKAQLRNLYVVIPLGNKDYEEDKFYIWDTTNYNFQRKLDEELAENPDNGVFPDPGSGKTVVARFTEESFAKNKYFECSRIDFEDRDGYDDAIMEQAPNLDEVLAILTYKEIQNIFLEIEEEEEGEEEEKSKPGGVPRRKAVPESESADEQEDNDQPAANPFARKKKTTAPPAEEPAEEEEEESASVIKKKAPISTPMRKKPSAPVAEEEEEEEETQKPKRSLGGVKQAPSKSNGKVSGTCPHGFKYGEDWDGYDACDDCEVFKACGAAHKK